MGKLNARKVAALYKDEPQLIVTHLLLRIIVNTFIKLIGVGLLKPIIKYRL